MFLLIIGAIIISFAPVLVKGIHLEPTWSAAWRLLIGTGLLFIIVLLQSCLRKSSLKDMIRKSKPSLIFLLIAGLFFGVDLFFWHRSIHYVGAGIATVLGNTQVLFLTAWSAIETRQRPTKRFLFAICIALLGLTLLVDLHTNHIIENYTLGVLFGLLTGLTYAIFLILLRKAGIKSPETPNTLKLFLFSFAAMIFLSTAALTTSDTLPQITQRDWGLLFLLGGAVHIGGWWIISKGLPKVTSAKAGLILLTQPVLATLLGWFFFKEHLDMHQIFGMGLTLTGIYLGESKS